VAAEADLLKKDLDVSDGRVTVSCPDRSLVGEGAAPVSARKPLSLA
jgi:hypothetical protein